MRESKSNQMNSAQQESNMHVQHLRMHHQRAARDFPVEADNETTEEKIVVSDASQSIDLKI